MRVEVTKEVVVTRAPPGLLLNWRLWLDTGTVTGMEKVGCGTADWQRERGDRKRGGGLRSLPHPHVHLLQMC